jgi:Carboxypeptidase regulatory-like domain
MMPARVLLALFTLVSAAFGQTGAGAGPPGVVEGSVVNLVQGAPLSNAHVLLTAADSPQKTLSVTTSPDGRFTFRDVSPGTYRLSASRRGFVDDGHEASSVTLQHGQELKGIVMQLAPFATIAGRVLDDSGEPLTGATIEILQPVYLNHQRAFVPVSLASTNDLGEFRAHTLVPGGYLVRTDFRDSNRKLGYTPTYYPNGRAANSATYLTVAPGQTLDGIQFQLRRVPLFAIRGRIGGATGSGMRTVWIQATANGEWIPNGKEVVPVHEGAFEICGVRPGRYVIAVDEFGATGGATASARLEVEVVDHDVEGMELNPAAMPELNGRVVMESSAKRDPKTYATQKGSPIVINLVPRVDPEQTNPPRGPVDASGAFQLTGGSAQVYDVEMLNLAPDLYLKAVRFGQADVTVSGVDRTLGAGAELTLVLSDAGGSVEGTVTGAAGPATSAVVVAVRQNGGVLNRKETRIDARGQFLLEGIAPGEYRIFAFERTRSGAPEDPDVLKQYESFSSKVTVAERSKSSLAIQAIPAGSIKD